MLNFAFQSLTSMSLIVACAVIISSAAVAQSDSKGSTVDVWLLGGQSNMQGIGKFSELQRDLPEKIPHAFFWNNKAFEPLVLGQTKTSSRAGEFGPEVGFSLEMAKTGRPLYLIKYHASGMPLHHGWNGNKWIGGDPKPGQPNFYPGDESNDPNTGRLYQQMLSRFRAGIQHLQAQGLTPVVRGFLWMQGEQDSKRPESATTYAENLKRLRNRLADDLRIDTLPMVFGQVLPHEPALPRFTHRKEIREQMAAADADSGEPEAISSAKMVSTDTFELLPDTVHYSAAGQLMLGKAMAEKMTLLIQDAQSH